MTAEAAEWPGLMAVSMTPFPVDCFPGRHPGYAGGIYEVRLSASQSPPSLCPSPPQARLGELAFRSFHIRKRMWMGEGTLELPLRIFQASLSPRGEGQGEGGLAKHSTVFRIVPCAVLRRHGIVADASALYDPASLPRISCRGAHDMPKDAPKPPSMPRGPPRPARRACRSGRRGDRTSPRSCQRPPSPT